MVQDSGDAYRDIGAVGSGDDRTVLLGLPWQQMGYSPAVGWGHTVNPVPNMSVYDLCPWG